MRRILVVAHKTLGGPALADDVRRRIDGGEVDGFHLLVPMRHPHDRRNWTDARMAQEAGTVLEQGLAQLRQLDLAGRVAFTGEVGDANPVYAVGVIVNRGERFDEIVVSTLPVGVSRWLRAGVPTRLAREFSVPVTQVVAERVPMFG